MIKRSTLILIAFSLLISISAFFLVLNIQEKIGIDKEEIRSFYQEMSQDVSSLSKKIPPYIPTGESVGFVLEFKNGIKLYFAGDTGLSPEIEMVGKYFKPDISFLPIGNIYYMDPKNAAIAAKILDSKYIIPTGYGTLPELEQNPEKFLEDLSRYGLEDRSLVFNPGEIRNISGIKIIFLGGKNWLVEGPEGTRILINPGIRYNPNFPKKYQDLVSLKGIDVVLVTDAHADNFTLSDARKWGQLFNPVFICPYELGSWLSGKLPYEILGFGQGSRIGVQEMRKLGVPENNLERIKLNSIDMVSASHSSSFSPEGFIH